MTPTVSHSRPRLVIEGEPDLLTVDPARVDAPEDAESEGSVRGTRGPLRAIDPGRRVSHLVPVEGGAPRAGVRWAHRLRRPRVSGPLVTIEPVTVEGAWALLVAPSGLGDLWVAGAPVRRVGLIGVGESVVLGPRLAIHLSAYVRPSVATVARTEGAQPHRCALCRDRLEVGQRIQVCECGARLHARASTPDGVLDCAGLGGCPDCRRALPPSSGYSWWPGRTPRRSPRVRHDRELRALLRGRVEPDVPHRVLASRAWDLMPGEVPLRGAARSQGGAA